MLRKGLIGLAIIITGVTIWYLGIKKYDYTIRFNIQKNAGLVYYELLEATQLRVDSLNGSLKLTDRGVIGQKLSHTLFTDDYTFLMDWELQPKNDNTTQVRVGLKEQEKSSKVRLQALLGHSLSRNLKQAFTSFDQSLEDRMAAYNTNYRGKAATPDLKHCACLEVSTTEENKARAMFGNIGLLNYFFIQNGIVRDGNPFLQLTSWDQETRKITFDFCFPMKQAFEGSKPEELFFKSFPERAALFSVFNGNYSGSQRNWYELLYRARNENSKVQPLPMEIFYDNPQISGNDSEWRADIYLPLEKQ